MMRALLVALLFLAWVPPAAQAQSEGCNPCECGIAIGCEHGGPVTIQVDEWDAPKQVYAGENVTLRFHANLHAFFANENLTGRSENARLGVTLTQGNVTDSVVVTAVAPGWTNVTFQPTAGPLRVQLTAQFVHDAGTNVTVQSKTHSTSGPGLTSMLTMTLIAIAARRRLVHTSACPRAAE